MKKGWFALLLAGALTLGLCGCRNQMAEKGEPLPSPEPAATATLELGPEDWEAEYYSCTVSGEESDYEVVARQLTEQYAQVLRARPQNAHQSVLDAQPDSFLDEQVYDAYYGEEDPNFCFFLDLYLDLAEDQVDDWMVGAELEEPRANSPYPTYWGWGREAAAAKGEDGNWHLLGTATGGAFVRLPVSFGHPGEHPDVTEMMAAWFLSEGETHDWRIPLFLDTEGYSAETAKAEVQKCPAEEQSAWMDDLRAYMAEYGGSYTWKAEDWRNDPKTEPSRETGK